MRQPGSVFPRYVSGGPAGGGVRAGGPGGGGGAPGEPRPPLGTSHRLSPMLDRMLGRPLEIQNPRPGDPAAAAEPPFAGEAMSFRDPVRRPCVRLAADMREPLP